MLVKLSNHCLGAFEYNYSACAGMGKPEDWGGRRAAAECAPHPVPSPSPIAAGAAAPLAAGTFCLGKLESVCRSVTPG